MKEEKYSCFIRVLHWLMSFTIIAMIALGWYMVDLGGKDPFKWELYKFHKTFGLILFVLFFARTYARFKSHIPSYPDSFSKSIVMAAKLVHKLLYGFMLIVPLSGILMSTLGGYGLVFFNYKLPNVMPVEKALAGEAHEIHVYTAYALFAVIAIHILGSLKHIIIDKFNILKRMA